MSKVATTSAQMVNLRKLANMPLASNGPLWPVSSCRRSSSAWVEALEETVRRSQRGDDGSVEEGPGAHEAGAVSSMTKNTEHRGQVCSRR